MEKKTTAAKPVVKTTAKEASKDTVKEAAVKSAPAKESVKETAVETKAAAEAKAAVNENNTVLCTFHIVVCCCQKLRYHALNIISNIASLCQRCRICDRKRHIQKFGKCFYQIGLTASGWSDHQHIGFLNFYFIHSICCYTFIMIINGYG